MTFAAPISAQDFQKGLEAAQSGDFETALKELKPLAEGGNYFAQSYLGAMYVTGQGVLTDFILAHMWVNIATANGIEIGSEHRENMAELMIPEEISKAQTMATFCMNSNYEKCGY